MKFRSNSPSHLISTIPREKKMIFIKQMCFKYFNQQDCKLLQIEKYIEMTSTTLSTSTMHMHSGAINRQTLARKTKHTFARFSKLFN